MTPALLFALTISSLTVQPGPVVPPPAALTAAAGTMIVLCAQADAHGKVVASRLIHSSGSAALDDSARSVVLGQSILDEATAAKHPGVWLPMAIATGDNPDPVATPSCSQDSASR